MKTSYGSDSQGSCHTGLIVMFLGFKRLLAYKIKVAQHILKEKRLSSHCTLTYYIQQAAMLQALPSPFLSLLTGSNITSFLSPLCLSHLQPSAHIWQFHSSVYSQHVHNVVGMFDRLL